MSALSPSEVDRYLERIQLDPSAIRQAEPTGELLQQLQGAHVRHVPFENLSIVGDPFAEMSGPGVSLDRDDLFSKLVERQRGGYCFELNGLFTSLLEALGFDVHRAAAMILPDDGDPSVPANHHVIIARLDREYVVDVGQGAPRMRQPVPLDGTEIVSSERGVAWRIVENARPQYRFTAELQLSDEEWNPRFIFDPTPRELSYFAAANTYLSTAPESPFTNNVIVSLDTADGWKDLKRETIEHVQAGERTERALSPDEWYEVLAEEFGLETPL
jgi:N-hydroxyarylamine O-acetyltransferase